MKAASTCLFLSISLIAQSACAEDIRDRLDQVAKEVFAGDKRAGTLIVSRNQQNFVYSHGERDIERHLSNTEDTIFLIASSAKHVTAAAVLRLVDQGRLRLDAKVGDLIPELERCELARAGASVTVHNLLNHTSGFPEAYDSESISRRLFQDPLGFRDFAEAIQCRPLKFTPGTRFEYSNTGYLLLGEIVRRVTGKSFGKFIDQEFFQPLGLRDSSVGRPNGTKPLALSYTQDRHGRKVDYLRAEGIRVRHDDDTFTDGNIYTNIRDFSIWIQKLVSGQVLSQASTAKMFTKYIDSYGYGWDIDQLAGETVFSHEGEWIGYQAAIVHVPAQSLTVMVFLNFGSIDGVAHKILEHIL